MSTIDPVLSHLDQSMDEALERLFALLRIPSISTDVNHQKDIENTAQWLADDLKSIGFEASVRPSVGLPMVVGHHNGAGNDKPHVLFYGHYDVQPVDPIELWEDDPFEPKLIERNGKKSIHGRGASDDKGQLMTFIEACRAFIAVHGNLPCRVTILLEGEEEIGSPSIVKFVEDNKQELSADYALVCDTTMWDEKTPAVNASLRGMVEDEITICAANRDLHSGYYGGVAANPIHILSKIIADLHDENGAVTLQGFYDGVYETPPDILAEWKKLNERELLDGVGLSKPSGENGRSILELTWARPTAEINGIWGGYTQPGFKTVIAAKASAKISFRLVHDQNPSQIKQAFREFVNARVPEDCRVEFTDHGEGSRGIQIPYDLPLFEQTKIALEPEWENKTAITCMGGSIPIVGHFKRLMNMDTLLLGFALADDQIHAPNEKYDLKSFHLGQRSWARILHALATQNT